MFFGRTVSPAALFHTQQSGSGIPMSFNDPIFANVVDSGALNLTNNQSISDLSIIGSNGDPVVDTNGLNNCTRIRIQAREGWRIGGSNGGGVVLNQCWTEVDGIADDHADGLQTYPGGGPGILTVNNSTFRAYRDADTSGVGSVGFFVADGWYGTITLNNVLFWGGQRSFDIAADQATITLDLKDVFFVGPFETGTDGIDIGEFGGQINITRWENVRNATIVDGVIVPGSLISQPSF